MPFQEGASPANICTYDACAYDACTYDACTDDGRQICPQAWRNLRERDRSEAKEFLESKCQRERSLLRRHYGDLLRSQSNLDHVTWLKLGVFLCDKAFPAFVPLANDGDLRLAAGSTYEL